MQKEPLAEAEQQSMDDSHNSEPKKPPFNQKLIIPKQQSLYNAILEQDLDSFERLISDPSVDINLKLPFANPLRLLCDSDIFFPKGRRHDLDVLMVEKLLQRKDLEIDHISHFGSPLCSLAKKLSHFQKTSTAEEIEKNSKRKDIMIKLLKAGANPNLQIKLKLGGDYEYCYSPVSVATFYRFNYSHVLSTNPEILGILAEFGGDFKKTKYYIGCSYEEYGKASIQEFLDRLLIQNPDKKEFIESLTRSIEEGIKRHSGILNSLKISEDSTIMSQGIRHDDKIGKRKSTMNVLNSDLIEKIATFSGDKVDNLMEEQRSWSATHGALRFDSQKNPRSRISKAEYVTQLKSSKSEKKKKDRPYLV